MSEETAEQPSDGKESPTRIGATLEPTLDWLESAIHTPQLAGLPTSLEEFDRWTGGLRKGSLTVIASRPVIGRSTFVSTVARTNAIRDGVPVLYVNLEETIPDITSRIIAAECRISLHRLRTGELDEKDWNRLSRRMSDITAAPLHLWTPDRLTAADLADAAREAVNEAGVKLIIIDGIQDIRPERRNDMREREVGDVVRDVKALARELDIPILATAHLNRAPEQRVDRMPMMDDLRESGAISFAADIIVFLHRPDAYVRDSPRAGEADLIIGKHRFGAPATITVAYQGHYGRFVDMAQT